MNQLHIKHHTSMDYITSNGHTWTTSHSAITHGPYHTYRSHMDHIAHIGHT